MTWADDMELLNKTAWLNSKTLWEREYDSLEYKTVVDPLIDESKKLLRKKLHPRLTFLIEQDILVRKKLYMKMQWEYQKGGFHLCHKEAAKNYMLKSNCLLVEDKLFIEDDTDELQFYQKGVDNKDALIQDLAELTGLDLNLCQRLIEKKWTESELFELGFCSGAIVDVRTVFNNTMNIVYEYVKRI